MEKKINFMLQDDFGVSAPLQSETMLFLTCSAPPWALHLEDCKLSLVSGRPGTVWGALVPHGLARL